MSPQPRHANTWNAIDATEPKPQAYVVTVANRQRVVYGSGPTAFELAFQQAGDYDRFLTTDIYSAAKNFVEGRFDIAGDPIRAVSFKAAHPGTALHRLSGSLVALVSNWRLESILQSRPRAHRNIQFHYDRSNQFYKACLDSRMVYSCAYFQNPDRTLEEAQCAKLDLICRKLDLAPGEEFLDIGCGWGALLLHAAGKYGTLSTGCTLSGSQAAYAKDSAHKHRLSQRLKIETVDFRDLHGRFDKIASVGMFEHVGRKRLRAYFANVFDLLSPDGLFLNHGIVRPQSVGNGPETRFLRNYVFPGGELAHLSDVVRVAEDVGFEVLDVENLRPHYAMTCRHWVRRLVESEQHCLETVGSRAYRIWVVYLSASALSFEEGGTDVCQVLLAKRSSRTRRLTRDYLSRS